jgi:hypothetical protein
VGSIPAPDAEQAMAEALTRLGPQLHALPDGETGERRNWIIHILESFRQHTDLELAKDGDYSDYQKLPRFRVRRGHKLSGDRLELGYASNFRASFPTFKAMRDKYGYADLAFQIGIPGDLDMALFSFGPLGILTKRRPFTEATVRDIEAVQREAGNDVIFQIEVPAELIFVTQMPPLIRPLMARYLAGGICRLARLSPEGARFGVHLCLGDMNHKSLATMSDVGPVVQLANAIGRRWPAKRRLEYVHAPMAAAEIPPTLEPNWYAPLSRLQLPPNTRFVAGCVHEDLSLQDQRAVLSIVEQRLGHRVDVATACGLGRRKREAALAAMDRTRELA